MSPAALTAGKASAIFRLLRLLSYINVSQRWYDSYSGDDDDGVDEGEGVKDEHRRVAGCLLGMVHVLHRTLYTIHAVNRTYRTPPRTLQLNRSL